MADPIIVFDLDGTLVDTAPDLMASLNHTIAAASLEPVSYDDLTHLVGHGARAMIERAFTLRQAPLSSDDLDRLMARFIDHYGANMPGDSKAFRAWSRHSRGFRMPATGSPSAPTSWSALPSR